MDTSNLRTMSSKSGLPSMSRTDFSVVNVFSDMLPSDKTNSGPSLPIPDSNDTVSELDKDRKKQISFRDARITGEYDSIWQSVGKCAFCHLRDKYVVFEENGIVLTIALYAYIDGHMMIIPRRHIRSVKELTPTEWETMRKFMYIAKKMIRTVHGIKGMQIIQKDGADAQSTVEHLHFHCVPFDSPDLTVWNYRKLTHTPIENTVKYLEKRDDIDKLVKRFAKKYQDD